jgi:hypothetical protein
MIVAALALSMQKIRRPYAAMALLAVGALLTITAAYAASITLNSSNVMALGGTGSVSVNCPISSTCDITNLAWTISSSSSSAPSVSGVALTFGNALAGTTSNSYTVYVTLYGSGTTVLATGSTTAAGGDSSATISSLSVASPPLTVSQVLSVEIDIVQTA